MEVDINDDIAIIDMEVPEDLFLSGYDQRHIAMDYDTDLVFVSSIDDMPLPVAYSAPPPSIAITHTPVIPIVEAPPTDAHLHGAEEEEKEEPPVEYTPPSITVTAPTSEASSSSSSSAAIADIDTVDTYEVEEEEMDEDDTEEPPIPVSVGLMFETHATYKIGRVVYRWPYDVYPYSVCLLFKMSNDTMRTLEVRSGDTKAHFGVPRIQDKRATPYIFYISKSSDAATLSMYNNCMRISYGNNHGYSVAAHRLSYIPWIGSKLGNWMRSENSWIEGELVHQVVREVIPTFLPGCTSIHHMFSSIVDASKKT